MTGKVATLAASITVRHSRGLIQILIAAETPSLLEQNSTVVAGECETCGADARGEVTYTFPAVVARGRVCAGCLHRVGVGDAEGLKPFLMKARWLGDHPWYTTSQPGDEDRYQYFRSRWDDRQCRRLGWWDGLSFRVIEARPGRIVNAAGRETGELVPVEQFP